MTPEVRQQFKDDLARMKYERDKFAGMATHWRQEAISLRKRRRFVEAMVANSRASEYRQTRDQRKEEISKLLRQIQSMKALAR